MCGIVAIYHKDAAVSVEKLTQATSTLFHRGPDGQKIWISKNHHIGMGHARLGITDLISGEQPLHSENGRIHVIVNGEFYEHEKIRLFMENKGYKFFTQSDSEILLALYQEFGYECLSHLNGEFAFVLWDEDKNIIFAARDRFGAKPLYYSVYKGNLYIASEIKALFVFGVPAVWEETSFLFTMSGVPSQSLSCFKRINQIKPGHYLLAELEKNKYQQHQYWDWIFPSAQSHREILSEDEYVEKFNILLKQSVKRRLPLQLPVACYLSGGIDSSAILALMAEIRREKIKAFNIAFIESETHNEFGFAVKMAQHVNAELVSIPVTLQDVADNYAKAVWHRESFLLGSNAVAKYILSRHVNAQGYKVVLTGEGADEMLGGYWSLKEDLSYYGKSLNSVNEKKENNSRSKNIRYEAVKAILGYYPAWFDTYCHQTIKNNHLFTKQFINEYQNDDPVLTFLKTLNLDTRIHCGNMSLYLWAKTHFSELILSSLGDRMEMSHSVEGRLPFLDVDLVDFMSSLPVTLKVKGTNEKYILKKSMTKKVAREIVKRQKYSFMAPPIFEKNKKSPVYLLMENVFSSDLITKVPFVNKHAVLTKLSELPFKQGEDFMVTEMLLHTLLSACFLADQFKLS